VDSPLPHDCAPHTGTDSNLAAGPKKMLRLYVNAIVLDIHIFVLNTFEALATALRRILGKFCAKEYP